MSRLSRQIAAETYFNSIRYVIESAVDQAELEPIGEGFGDLVEKVKEGILKVIRFIIDKINKFIAWVKKKVPFWKKKIKEKREEAETKKKEADEAKSESKPEAKTESKPEDKKPTPATPAKKQEEKKPAPAPVKPAEKKPEPAKAAEPEKKEPEHVEFTGLNFDYTQNTFMKFFDEHSDFVMKYVNELDKAIKSAANIPWLPKDEIKKESEKILAKYNVNKDQSIVFNDDDKLAAVFDELATAANMYRNILSKIDGMISEAARKQRLSHRAVENERRARGGVKTSDMQRRDNAHESLYTMIRTLNTEAIAGANIILHDANIMQKYFDRKFMDKAA